MSPRTIVACVLVVLAAPFFAPSAQADLAISLIDASGYDILAQGASSLDAPQNLTIQDDNHGFLLQWEPPVDVAGLPIVGYTYYRVPGPGQAGSTVVKHFSANRDSYTDRQAEPGDLYVYFVTASYGPGDPSESIPSSPVSTADVSNYPHCGVASVYTSPPYYDVHLSCLFPGPV